MKRRALLLLISVSLFGKELTVESFFFNCEKIDFCTSLKDHFIEMENKSYPREYIVRMLEEAKSSFHDHEMSYDIKIQQSRASVYLKIVPASSVSRFSITTKSNIDLSRFPIPKKGDRFSDKDLVVLIDDIKIFLETKGYKDPEVKVKKVKQGHLLFIDIDINEGYLQRLKKVEVIGDDQAKKTIYSRLEKFKNRVWDRSSIDIEIANITNHYRREGYYLFKCEITDVKKDKNNSVVPVIKVIWGPQFGLDIKGNKVVSRSDIVNNIRGLYIARRGEVSELQFKESIQEMYLRRGLYYSKIKVAKMTSPVINRSKDVKEKILPKRIRYFITINEGRHLEMREIRFIGAQKYIQNELKQHFIKQGSILIKRGHVDEFYIKNFVEEIKKYYFRKGFIFAKINGFEVRKDVVSKTSTVLYRIAEGKQVFWSKLNLIGIPDKVRNLALKNVKNREGGEVNLADLKSDIQTIENNIKDHGYFFAQILNKESKEIIQYSKDYSSAALMLRASLGEVIRFNNVIVIGADSTDNNIIEREVFLKKSEKITPSKIQVIRTKIAKTGLFSSVSVRPFLESNSREMANLLISVKEKKFGFMEFAPGFRSDIGFKFSTKIGYNNLFGKNHAMILNARVNQRLDESSFDTRRRKEKQNRLEFKTSLRYNWPYFISLPVDSSTLFSFSRRRLRSFDVDIIHGSFTLRKDWVDWLSTTIRYQIELDKQFDETNPEDIDNFSVGSVIPGITFDFRDRPINPSSGTLFNLSAELARPYLGSREGNKYISYDKIVSRNVLYVPLSRNKVLAFSLAAGVQSNRGRERPIPNIKTFRLNGVDRVRGFTSNEINRLNIAELGHPSIDHVDVYNKIYFTNLKLEFRYSMLDFFVMTPFLDAGRVMLNHYQPFDLRMGAGLGAKFVTPVGVLNFDYGVKLKRNRFLDEGEVHRDSFGRFHLTLGFF